MATTYSMDLGIDTNASGGAAGTPRSPYPMQIALTQGTLDSTGAIFTPLGLSSWRMFGGGDLLVVRVFDITLESSLIEGISWGACHANGLDFRPKKLFMGENFVKSASQQPCPGFAAPNQPDLPCWILRLADGKIETFPIETNDTARQYLLTATLGAYLNAGPGAPPVPKFYQDDPEMVVGPDNGGGVPAPEPN